MSKTCSFFISGKANKRAVNVVSWNKEAFSGTLDAAKDGVKLKIAEGREHPGCGLVLSPQISEGLALDLVYKADWTDLRVVSSPRVYLHSEPADLKKMRSYLVKGDVVGVLSQKGDWLQVEYPGQKKTSKGWIKANDTVKPVQPGQK